ncbi:MAG: cyclic nucleotide-binding domain-containing protein, partial [Hyphomicrobium denitrificans]|nr:cyclic nucleotide-binding domain-containing protein [Hyphomicrobium denitrificans]
LVAELAMRIEIAHPTTIVARDQVRALRISREKMHELMSQDVDLASHFSSLILKRLHILATDLLAVETLLSGSVTAAVSSESRLEFSQGDRARAMQ